MSEETVRYAVTLKPLPRRLHGERLALRFPRALALVARTVQRLPASSRLRQAALRLTLERLCNALNRADHDVAFALWNPDCESFFPSKFATVGLKEKTRGLGERIRFQEEWRAAWGGFHLIPEEIIDQGDGRGVVLGRMKGSGVGSGAAFDTEWGAFFTFVDGIREKHFLTHLEALEAAGLSE